MATIQNINVGTTTNDGTGDTIRNAFIKTNDNFTSVNSDLALKATLASPTITGTLTTVNDVVINSIKVGKGAGNISSNTALGEIALIANTTGYNNTSLGTQTLQFNTTGNNNTANGVNALSSNTTGDYNTATGVSTLQSNTIGSANTANGYAALSSNTTGTNNTANGNGSLSNNTTGYLNSALGVNSLSSNTTYANCSGIGSSSQVTGDAQIQLGNSATTTYVYGTVQNRSDLRDKADVRNTVLGLDFISKLRPVDYKWDMREDYKTEAPSPLSEDATEEEKEAYKIVMDEWLESVKLDNLTHDGTNKRNRFHHGLIAQEVQDIIEETGVDFGGFQDHKISQGQDVLSIGYDELIAPMIKAIQELKAEIELLKAN
jgi:hypothetical protein